MPGLNLNDIVNVGVSLAPQVVGSRNFGALLILGASNVIDVSERRRLYSTLAAVGADFGTAAPEYAAALLFFAQRPQPSALYIGRWARTATSGILHGGALAAAEQLPSAWTGITNGGLSITIDGTAKALTGLNFSAIQNMNAVAAVINTALGASASCVWNSVYSRFDIASASTGAASTVSYASAPGSGTNIAAQTRLTAASNALAPVAGIVSELVTDAVNAQLLSPDWYGLTVADPNPVAADHVAVATLIETASPSRIYGVTSSDANGLNPASTTDVFALLNAGGFSRTTAQYSSTTPYAVASLMGRAFGVDLTANNSTISLMFKNEPAVTAETLTEAQAAALQTKKANVFVNYQGGTAIIQNGTMSNGYYFDEVQGTDFLQNTLQTNILAALYGNATKVPQTDAGVNQLVAAAAAACSICRANGLLASGTWTGPAFGPIKTGDTLTDGFQVFANPISSQSAADRAARKSPTIQIAVKLAGAVHMANVLVNVNR